MPAHPKPPYGFSLAELLTALAVIGIGASMAVPAFNSVLKDGQRAAGINHLVGDLHVARSEAIKRNVDVAICPSRDGMKCSGSEWQEGWLVFTDADLDRRAGEPDIILRHNTGVNGLSIRSEEFDRYLVYRPDGHVMVDSINDNTGDFTVCDSRGSDAARVLNIGISGQPRLSGQLADGRDPDCDPS